MTTNTHTPWPQTHTHTSIHTNLVLSHLLMESNPQTHKFELHMPQIHTAICHCGTPHHKATTSHWGGDGEELWKCQIKATYMRMSLRVVYKDRVWEGSDPTCPTHLQCEPSGDHFVVSKNQQEKILIIPSTCLSLSLKIMHTCVWIVYLVKLWIMQRWLILANVLYFFCLVN